jgi:hypothetical protein
MNKRIIIAGLIEIAIAAVISFKGQVLFAIPAFMFFIFPAFFIVNLFLFPGYQWWKKIGLSIFSATAAIWVGMLLVIYGYNLYDAGDKFINRERDALVVKAMMIEEAIGEYLDINLKYPSSLEELARELPNLERAVGYDLDLPEDMSAFFYEEYRTDLGSDYRLCVDYKEKRICPPEGEHYVSLILKDEVSN